MTNSHKRHNHMKKMKINGIWYEESSLCKDIANAFQALMILVSGGQIFKC